MFNFTSRALGVATFLPIFLLAKADDKKTKKEDAAKPKKDQKSIDGLKDALKKRVLVINLRLSDFRKETEELVGFQGMITEIQKKAEELQAKASKRTPKELTPEEKQEIDKMLQAAQQKLALADKALETSIREIRRRYNKALLEELPEAERMGYAGVEIVLLREAATIFPGVNRKELIEAISTRMKRVYARLVEEANEDSSKAGNKGNTKAA